jgi:hypothetical protein
MFCRIGIFLTVLLTSTFTVANCDSLKNLEVTSPKTTVICKPQIEVLFGYSNQYRSPAWGVYQMRASLAAKPPIYLRYTGLHTPVTSVPVEHQSTLAKIFKSDQTKAFLIPHYNVLNKASQAEVILTMANVIPVRKTDWKKGSGELIFELGANERVMALEKGDFMVVSGVVYHEELVKGIASAKYIYKAYYHDKYNYTLSYLIPVDAKSTVLSTYITSVRCIEKVSGHVLFSGFDNEIKSSILHGVAHSNKHWVSPNQKEATCSFKS